MAEALRPLTLLLGGAALWSLCLLVLALGGLGSRFPAPPAAVAPPPLPKVSLTRAASRLGAWPAYAEVGRRPVMNEGRQPAVFAASADAAGSAELDVSLSSVLITSGLKMALLTDNKDGASRRVRLGDVIEGSNWRLVSLEPRRAVLEGPSGQRTLDLRVFDGSSGEAPTPLGSVDGAHPVPAGPPVPPTPAQNVPAKPPVAQNAGPAPVNVRPDPNQMSQEQQVEAIRRRIEARRAQMRAEAEAGANDNR